MNSIIKHTKEFLEKRKIHSKTKVCAKCGVEKDRSVFAKDKGRADGRSSYCFDCRSAYNRESYKRNQPRFYNSARRWAAENPQKRKAHRAISYAVKSGKIKKPNICSVCYKEKRLEAHHWHGYDKEHILDVQWLCHACHEEASTL